MVSIVLTKKQVEQIIAQEQQNAPPPVDPGLPATRPPTYIPPPATANITRSFSSIFNAPFLKNPKGAGNLFPDLSQRGLWDVRLIKANTFEVLWVGKWGNIQSMTVNQLGYVKDFWNRYAGSSGTQFIRDKLNALTMADTDYLVHGKNWKNPLYDVAYVPGDYILEVIDERGQVFNLTWTQTSSNYKAFSIYTAQGGANRFIYCTYFGAFGQDFVQDPYPADQIYT